MAARRRVFVLLSVLVGGLACAVPGKAAGQVTDPGVDIVGSNVSGQWDFEMNVIYRSDPAIPASDTFLGSFAVEQTESAFTGSGTFNDLDARVGGTVTQDPLSLSVTLNDHIATTDSETHFTATLVSGDFYTGTFKGATLDESARWDGVFNLKITRPTTQTPAQQIESAFNVASRRMRDVAQVASVGISEVVTRAESELAMTLGRRSLREALHRGKEGIRTIRLSSLAEIDRVRASFSATAEGIIASLPMQEQGALRRLAGTLRGQLGEVAAVSRHAVNDATMNGERLLFDVGRKSIEIREGFLVELEQIARIIRHLSHPPPNEHITAIVDKLGALVKRVVDALRTRSDAAISNDDLDCLLTILDGEDPDLSDEDAPPPLPGLISLLEERDSAGQIPPGGAVGFAKLLAKKFGVPLSDDELQRLADDLRTAINILSMEDVEKKLIALKEFAQRLRRRLGR